MSDIEILFRRRSPNSTPISKHRNPLDLPSMCRIRPRSQSADKVGIATIIISCLSNTAKAFSDNITALIPPELEKEMKKLLENCAKGFSEAKTDLAKATNILKNKDYDETNRLI
ncbi:hypothetical protein V6N13_087847 [Hibiscus sabdariffa]|uniref:Uncharacterized protein n=2 Tax=Hibiscus sabdariffa TaxID=183260 RepID=A0ABR1ZAX5_9ROSI